MKKIAMALLIAGSLVACNSGTSSSGDVKDSVINKIDSTTQAKVDTIKAQGDSLKKEVKQSFDKTDSANKAISKTAVGKGHSDSAKKH